MKRIEKLRKVMEENNVDAYIVYSQDPHNSEYVADRWKGREWLSGFTGSAGTLVILKDHAGLWTDGRYFIQALDQISDKDITLYKMAIEGEPTIEEFLNNRLEYKSTLAFDGQSLPLNSFNKLKEALDGKEITYRFDDLLLEVWDDRPDAPNSIIYEHWLKHSGGPREAKISKIKSLIKETSANDYILTTLDDIAWLFNIRASDINYSPVALAYALISEEKVTLYCNTRKIENSLKLSLGKSGVIMKEYNDIYSDLAKLDSDRKVLVCEKSTNVMLKDSINSDCQIITKDNIVQLEKSKKCEEEINHIKNSHIRDGVAMVRFLKWLDENVGKMPISEMDIDDKLVEFRSMGDHYVGESFNSIVGYKEHGALMHYKATKESNYDLEPNGMLLVDSGALYFDGTTDITRTIALGEVTDEEKRDFTLVLKGMMSLSKAKFLKGTVGSSLDILARQFLWEESIDYKCGTGHGVGYFLNVHEGPQGISMKLNSTVLEKGMILTNEPGVYKEGRYGIRIENTLVVSEHSKTEFGEFYKFEDLTYCPIDIRLIDTSIMQKLELEQINEYHKNVYETLRAHLSQDEEECLRSMTKAI